MLGHLQVTRIEREDEVLYMDFATRQNLELVQSLHEMVRQLHYGHF